VLFRQAALVARKEEHSNDVPIKLEGCYSIPQGARLPASPSGWSGAGCAHSEDWREISFSTTITPAVGQVNCGVDLSHGFLIHHN